MGTLCVLRQADERRACRSERNTRRKSEWPGRRDRTGRHERRDAIDKVMIIDGNGLITGSYNFTYSAAYDNAENLLYIRNAPALVKAYINNWRWRQSCSQPYTGRPLT